MNRKKLKQSLILINLIVLIGLLVFYPTSAGEGYFYSNEFERVINRFVSLRQWPDIWAIFILSLLATSSIYLFITAFNDEKN
ncbi:MAG: hypothetical protein ACR2NI_14090 [Pirellulales bacterium]|jgi:hypothetical protein